MQCSRSTLAAVTSALCLSVGFGLAPRAMGKEPLTVTAASVGFGGRYKAGFWNPIRLSVTAGPQGAAGQLEMVVPDGDQVPVIFSDERVGRIDLQAGEQTSVLLYAKTGPSSAPITVRLRSESGAIWTKNLTPLVSSGLPASDELVVGIGPSVGLVDVQPAFKRRADVALVTAEVKSPVELPDRWWGYEGVDTIVFTTRDREFFDQVTADQREALFRWVQLGGRFIFCVGAEGEKLLANDSPWARFVPGTLADVAPLRDGSGLETFTANELPLADQAFQRNRPQATRLADVRGKVLVEEGGTISANRPLIVHAPHGLGQVIFVGLDLDHPALAAWKGRSQLLVRLLQSERAQRDEAEREPSRSVTHLGYKDMVGQLRAALDQFPGVTLVNFTTVSILTIAYLLLVGPADYLFLSRLGWPRQRTWITFPVVALALAFIAWFVGRQSHGQYVRLNQAEIVDLDLEQRVARGTVWTHLYSPATQHYEAALEIDMPGDWIDRPAGWLTWQGLPGESLGGLSSRQVQLAAAEPYRVASPDDEPMVSGLPVAAASSKSLSGRWWAEARINGEAHLEVNQFGVLTGDFAYPLPVVLSDCLVIHGEKLYRLGTLRPGQMVQMEDYTPLNLEARLTQRSVVLSKDVSTPWDRASTDVSRIVLMMMFHDSARGSSYTGLTGRYQPYIDLTEHVRLGRAVLVGRAEKSVCRLLRDESPLAGEAQAQSWTWYRVILPVSPQQSVASP